ncbi:hypothetical protein LINPERPRIM_LOCUS8287 [Linum perenne]
MAGTTTLPKFVVFYSESVGKYANFVATNDAIQVMGKQVWSPHSKFEVEQSMVHPTMVHIRCSYNNKYLQRRDSDDPNDNFIFPLADEPEDDQTKLTSTLFVPEFSSGGDTVSLLHVQQGLYVQCINWSGTYSLMPSSPTPMDPYCMFRFTNWESLVTLPKHLRFKGDNGAYLGLLLGESGVTLRFQIRDYDPNNKTIVHELVALSDGTVRIKNAYQGAFWSLNTNSTDGYILADGSTSAPTLGSVFQPVKVDDKTIAIRNMENRLYCKRYPAGTPDNSLCANENQVIDYARLELIELVTSKTINDIAFDQPIGWVYDKIENVTLNDKGQVVSNETDETKTIAAKIYYKDTKTSSTWASFNSSLKLGPIVTIKPDQIPIVTDSSTIVMSDPFQTSYVWGETTTKDSDEYKVHSVTLKPWTMVTVQMKASLATCHVPFSYTRYDVLDETTRQPSETHLMDDGVYTGTNYFNFTFDDSEPKSIPKKK